MSGFEVVGLILGIWPLVRNAVSLYKATKGGPGRDFFQELKTEELIFTESVKKLLASNVSEPDFLQLSDTERPNLALWKDNKLLGKLDTYMGREKSAAILQTLEMIETVLNAIKDQVGNIKLTDSRDKNPEHILRRSKYGLPSSNLKQNLDSLHFYNNQLRRLLISHTSSSAVSEEQSLSSRDTLRRISNHFSYLYNAICNGYRCQCSSAHQAILRSPYGPDRKSHSVVKVTEPFELLFPFRPVQNHTYEERNSAVSGDDVSIGISSDLDLSSCSSIESTTSTAWSPRNSDSRSAATSISLASQAPGQQIRSLSVCESEGELNDGLIVDLCSFIKSMSSEAECQSSVGFISQGQRKYTMQVTSPENDPQDYQNFVCLEDYLPSNKKWELSRRNRMRLASSLSLTIMVLFSTPWIDMWWTWKDFYILTDDRSQLFIKKKFYSVHSLLNPDNKSSTDSLPTPTFWACFGEPELTRLGFALIELALGKRLAELRPQEVGYDIADQDMLDLMTARKIVESGAILEEAGQRYHDVVNICLTHQVIENSGVKGISSKHVDFQLDLERFVVGPLMELYARSWG